MSYATFLFVPGEIDRCLKKVSEGVETFEDIWKKVRLVSTKFASLSGNMVINCR